MRRVNNVTSPAAGAVDVHRWWETLPGDFHRQPFAPGMAPSHGWKVGATAAVDLGLRTGAAALVGAAAAPHLLRAGGFAREDETLDFYRRLVDGGDRDAIFQRPPRGVLVESRRPPALAYHPPGIPHRILRFDSPHVALNPALRAQYARHERSHRSVAQHWYHPDGPRPTLVFLHGFLADNYWFNSLMFSLRWFWQQGWDVMLVTLPFHGVRRAALDPFSGFGLFAHGFAHFNEAMVQAVADVRVLVDWLASRGTPAIGISGLSLGGYLAAMVASVEDRLAFCIPNSGVVSPVDMMREWAPLSWAVERLMQSNGIGISHLRHGVALHCPLSWTPRISARRLLIIGGAGDRLVHPRYIDLLHRHWQGSAVHWFPGNHLVHLHQRDYLRLMLRFINDSLSDK